MKIGRLVIELLKYRLEKENSKRRASLVINPQYNAKIDISYIDDNNENHKFDLYFAPNNKKNCLIIDIHGGSYIFGHRRENYDFGTVFLDAGYDFTAIDYVPNNGKMDTKDLIDQCIKCICYILDNYKELGLESDKRIILTGDSAGGHLALSVAELFLDKKYQKELGYDLPSMNLVGVMLNCPVFNYAELGLEAMNKGGNKRLFGPNAYDIEHRKSICPCTHIDSLSVPLFASTCKNDFLRGTESLKLKEVVESKDIPFTFLDIDDEDKRVGHVHNLLDISLDASKKVNQAMVDFADKLVK